MTNSLATLAFVLLLAAWAQRRRRRVHVPLALAGIALDLGLVVALELQRDVVAHAVESDMGAGELVHVVSSVAAVVLYLPTLWFGFALLRGRGGPTRTWHRRVAYGALACRAVGFATMWLLPGATRAM